MKRVAWLAVAALALPAYAPARAAACASAHRHGAWTTIDLPAGIKPAGATDFALAPGRRGRVFVHDDANVWRTDDSGCTWKKVFTPDRTVDVASGRTWGADPGYTVTAVAAGPHDLVYAMLADQSNTGTLVYVPPTIFATSGDGGVTWRIVDPSLVDDVEKQMPRCQQFGEALRLQVAPTDPKTLYLDCSHHFGVDFWLFVVDCQDAKYVSHDGGATWRALRPEFGIPVVGPPAAPCDGSALGTVDQRAAGTLWRVSRADTEKGTRSVVERSTDGVTYTTYAAAQTDGPRGERPFTAAGDVGYGAGPKAGWMVVDAWSAARTTRITFSRDGGPGRVLPLPPGLRHAPYGASPVEGCALGAGNAELLCYNRVPAQVAGKAVVNLVPYWYDARRGRWTTLSSLTFPGKDSIALPASLTAETAGGRTRYWLVTVDYTTAAWRLNIVTPGAG